MHMQVIALAVAFAIAAAAVAAEQGGPATRPAEYLIGELHMQDLPAFTYFYRSAETTLPKVGQTVEALMAPINKAAEEGKVRVSGPAVLFYGDFIAPDQPFTIEAGYPVPENTAAFGDFRVRRIPARRCATLLYTGPLPQIRRAHEKFWPAIFAAGLKPAGGVCEVYLYFENPASPNNVVQFQVEVR